MEPERPETNKSGLSGKQVYFEQVRKSYHTQATDLTSLTSIPENVQTLKFRQMIKLMLTSRYHFSMIKW